MQSPLQNRNKYSVTNSLQFSKGVFYYQIDDNEVFISFNHVLSLFTIIPVNKACDYIEKKLEQNASLPFRANLDMEDIISLL